VTFVSVTVLIIGLPRLLGRQFQIHLVREIVGLPDLNFIARRWGVDNVPAIDTSSDPNIRIIFDPIARSLPVLCISFGHLSVEGGGDCPSHGVAV
jgi:hypothetical protein